MTVTAAVNFLPTRGPDPTALFCPGRSCYVPVIADDGSKSAHLQTPFRGSGCRYVPPPYACGKSNSSRPVSCFDFSQFFVMCVVLLFETRIRRLGWVGCLAQDGAGEPSEVRPGPGEVGYRGDIAGAGHHPGEGRWAGRLVSPAVASGSVGCCCCFAAVPPSAAVDVVVVVLLLPCAAVDVVVVLLLPSAAVDVGVVVLLLLLLLLLSQLISMLTPVAQILGPATLIDLVLVRVRLFPLVPAQGQTERRRTNMS